MTVLEIRDMIAEADPTANHYYSEDTSGDYTTWQEYSRLPMSADDRTNKGWNVQIDRYTRKEFDRIADELERVMDERMLSYTHQVEFEPETKFIRHIFDCEAL